MKAKSPKRGRAGLGKDQPVQGVDFASDTKGSQIPLWESIRDLPPNAADILQNALREALDALEGRFA